MAIANIDGLLGKSLKHIGSCMNILLIRVRIFFSLYVSQMNNVSIRDD